MEFAELTKRVNRDLYDACDRASLQRFGKAIERAGGLAPMLKVMDKSLEPFSAKQLTGLAVVHRELVRWKDAVRELRRVIAQSGLKLPDGILTRATTPHEISALERAARMCQRAGHENHDGWLAAVDAHLELWRSCVSLCIAEGFAAIAVAKPEHPEAEEFASSVCARVGLGEIAGFRWLPARRGQRAGILSIALDLPRERMMDQAEARLSSLGLASRSRGARSVLEELVLNDIEGAVLSVLDHRSRTEALRTAASAYEGLLSTPPIQAEALLAIHVGSRTAPIGVAVVDNSLEPTATAEIELGTDIEAALATFVSPGGPEMVALPVSAEDDERLRKVCEATAALGQVRVLTAALREARKDLPHPPAVSSAVVLARRVLAPAKEFGRIPPAALGLGEYSREVNEALLTEVLEETRLVALWERKQQAAGRKPQKRKAIGKAVPAVRRLNPLVKTIRDLRPGMMLDGVVTNLTRFGAFVNVGLPTEAMIHVSQLSTEFVDEPSQVVRVGQPVTARVLEVVPEKSRIALTLKPEQEASERQSSRGSVRLDTNLSRGGGPGASSRPIHKGNPLDAFDAPRSQPKDGEKKSRSAALADLDALFKK